MKNKYIIEFNQSFDSGDKWGSVMGWGFALCDFLSDNLDCPDYWEFNQSCMGSDSDSFEYGLIDDLFSFKEIDCEEAILHFSDILFRYKEILEKKELNY